MDSVVGSHFESVLRFQNDHAKASRESRRGWSLSPVVLCVKCEPSYFARILSIARFATLFILIMSFSFIIAILKMADSIMPYRISFVSRTFWF